MTDERQIEDMLRDDGQLVPGPVVVTPLTGGVSCEIFRVEQGARRFVVKRALARLRVAEEWLADTSRNETEFAFYESLSNTLAGTIPCVFFHNPQRGYFIMEDFGEGWQNWKTLLLDGVFEEAHGVRAGALLAKLHGGTWKQTALLERFDTRANFRQLRTDPYFRAAAAHHPELRGLLLDEADALERSGVCLIHGDFSPKNILVNGGRMVLLDAEVACCGDPAFDVAFLQAHLFLKGLHFFPQSPGWDAVSAAAWDSYRNAMGALLPDDFEARCIRTLAALLIARVDGKSPVEYLSEKKRGEVRVAAAGLLQNPPSSHEHARTQWFSMMK